MSGRLVCFVHVTDDEGVVHAFGPDDDVPGWAVAKITNPDVWVGEAQAEPDTGSDSDDAPASDPDGEAQAEPDKVTKAGRR